MMLAEHHLAQEGEKALGIVRMGAGTEVGGFLMVDPGFIVRATRSKPPVTSSVRRLSRSKVEGAN